MLSLNLLHLRNVTADYNSFICIDFPIVSGSTKKVKFRHLFLFRDGNHKELNGSGEILFKRMHLPDAFILNKVESIQG